jgi:hypothetical protein
MLTAVPLTAHMHTTLQMTRGRRDTSKCGGKLVSQRYQSGRVHPPPHDRCQGEGRGAVHANEPDGPWWDVHLGPTPRERTFSVWHKSLCHLRDNLHWAATAKKRWSWHFRGKLFVICKDSGRTNKQEKSSFVQSRNEDTTQTHGLRAHCNRMYVTVCRHICSGNTRPREPRQKLFFIKIRSTERNETLYACCPREFAGSTSCPSPTTN